MNKHKQANIKSKIPPVDKVNNGSLYKILWYIVLSFVFIIFIKQLKNDPTLPENENEIKASFHAFFNGTFQESVENKLLKKPFISNLKKQKNEYEYKFFEKINLEDAFVGKDNYIFGENMTKAYFGDDYYGEETIKIEVKKAKFVQSKLKALGIEMLILFAPGKSSIYTEFLPDNILKTKKKTTNYQTYVKECENQNINFIDFVRFFSYLKANTQYPLFSRYGTHWSYYSECIVVDTTIKKLEKLMNVNLPNIKYNNIVLKDTSLVRDGDIFRKTQMEIPKGNFLAYPLNITFDKGPEVVPQKILAIGDSYFRGFFYLGAMQQAFNNSQQWYYYNSIIPENPNNPEVWELDLKTEILKNKAILILCNEMNLKNLGNGFIDDAFELFYNPKKYYINKKAKDEINKLKKEIRSNKELLSLLTKESQQKGITLDSLITEAATKLKNGNKKN